MAMERGRDFDVAVLDVPLNGRNVFDFAGKLTADMVPFIFATGYDERGVPERHRGCPALQKPFLPDALKRALEKLALCAPPPGAYHTSGQAIST